MKHLLLKILPRVLAGWLCLVGTSLLSGTSTLPRPTGLASGALTPAAGPSRAAPGSARLPFLPDKPQCGCETFAAASNVVLFHVHYLVFLHPFYRRV